MRYGRPPAALLAFFLLIAAVSSPARAAFGDITLVGQHAFGNILRITNVWGYRDWEAGREYALVGDWYGGFTILDVTDPSNPQELSRTAGAPGFDFKPWGHYVYACDGNQAGRDTRIVDISDPLSPVLLPTRLPSCHTMSISSRGVLYQEYPGITIFDLLSDPENPDSLTHVANTGHDSTPRGDRLYDFNGGALNIWNVSDPSNPTLIGTDDDPTIVYYHSGDESQDHNYLYVCDEYAVTPSPDIVVYDVSNPAAPTRIGDINDPTSRVHQLYVVGDLMFVGYYTAGFKVFDITNPATPVLADAYDTSPFQAETGSDWDKGAYNAYPFASTGIVYVSDFPTGLFLFSVEGHAGSATGVVHAPSPAAVLHPNVPNPFNPSTTVAYETSELARVRLAVYDVRGALVRVLVDERQPAGPHRAVWNGVDDTGRPVPSGVYYCRLEAGPTSTAIRMVLLK
jgi:choice-of-anchor B domain-containing protein